MFIEEFLIRLGFNAEGAAGFSNAINSVQDNANRVNRLSGEISDSLSGAANNAGNSLNSISDDADKTTSRLGKAKLAIVALFAGVALLGRGLASSFNSAIDNAKNLYYQRNALFKVTTAEINQAAQYKRAMAATGIAIDSIKTKIALNLAPALTQIANGFKGWLTVNKDLIANGITQVIKFLGKVVQVIVNTIRFIDKIVSSTIGWKNALIVLGVAWAVFNRALLFSPIGIAVAAITGLMLVIDDLMSYLNGGKSLFGSYWDPLISGAKKTWQVISLFVGLIKSLFTGNFDSIKQAANAFFTALTDYAQSAVNFIVNIFANTLKSILKFFGMTEEGAQNVVNKIGDIFNTLIDIIVAPFKFAWSIVSDLFDIWTDDTTSLTDKIIGSFASLGDKIIALFKYAMSWIKDKFVGFIDGVTSKVKGVLSFIGIDVGDDSESGASALGDQVAKLSVEQIQSAPQSASANNSAKTVNQGDMTNNIVINTSDTTLSAKQAGDLIFDQLTNANNNAKSAIGAY